MAEKMRSEPAYSRQPGERFVRDLFLAFHSQVEYHAGTRVNFKGVLTVSLPRLAIVISTVALLAVAGAGLADEPTGRTALAKIGKAATALVEVKSGPRVGYGSAFCIHSSGLFVTNDHVVNPTDPTGRAGIGIRAEVALVVNPGQKTEKIYSARVVRSDKQLDLALIRIDGAENLSILTLGDDEQLVELADVIAFGFPFGAGIGEAIAGPRRVSAASTPREYPSISVNAGSITALRRKDGALDRIQLDATINPGNSGGPLLDKDGKVIGLITSIAVAQGLGRTGISSAIPVSHLKRFLARPEIVLTLPAVDRSNQNQPAEFRARIVNILPTTAPMDLELMIERPGETAKTIPMSLKDSVYVARAVAFPGRNGPLTVRVEVKFEDGSVTGLVDDREFKVDDQKLKLSQIDQVRLGSKAKIKATGGAILDGRLDGLESLQVKVGQQTIGLSLKEAVELKIGSPESDPPVNCTVIARLDGKEVGRINEALYLEGTQPASMDALKDGKFIKPRRSNLPVSYLRAVSSPGDYIGQGKTYEYPGDALTVRRDDRGVSIRAGSQNSWNLLFGAPTGRFLEAAEYRDAKRHAFSGQSPGIEFTGNGRGCNQIHGHFVVWELEVDGNAVTKLAIDFVQRCEGNMPPLYGRLRYRSSFE